MIAKAFVATAKGKVEICNMEVNDPKENQIQMQVEYSVISPGTERAFINNLPNTPGEYPFYLGYSCSGIVTKVGANVKCYKTGDRVASNVKHQSVINVDIVDVVKVPDDVPLKEASFVFMGNICMQGIRKARIDMAESVVVLGLGVIGQLTVQFAKLSGGLPVIGLDMVDYRMEKALQIGADYVINTKQDDWIDQVKAIAGEPPVVIESTGFPDPINLSLQVAAPYGRVILLASTRGDTTVNFYRDVHKKYISIIGAHVTAVPKVDSYPGYSTWQDNYKDFMKLLKFKKLNINELISELTTLDTTLDFYDKILSWDTNTITAVIKWN